VTVVRQDDLKLLDHYFEKLASNNLVVPAHPINDFIRQSQGFTAFVYLHAIFTLG